MTVAVPTVDRETLREDLRQVLKKHCVDEFSGVNNHALTEFFISVVDKYNQARIASTIFLGGSSSPAPEKPATTV